MSNDDSTISYDYSQCQNIYEDLLHDQGTIDSQISSLENTINGLMRTWTGLSADQWQTIHNQWATAMGNMVGDLRVAASTLPEMAGNMGYTDRSAADRIASIARP